MSGSYFLSFFFLTLRNNRARYRSNSFEGILSTFRCSPRVDFLQVRVCFHLFVLIFMLSTNSYVSESDASLNLLLFRLSIALSSSKSRFDSASSVFFFSAAIFNLTWSTS